MLLFSFVLFFLRQAWLSVLALEYLSGVGADQLDGVAGFYTN